MRDVCFIDTFRDNMRFSLQIEIAPMNKPDRKIKKNILNRKRMREKLEKQSD